MNPRVGARTLLILAATIALPAFDIAQTAGQPVRLVGAAIDRNTGRTSHIEIDIRRWSTHAETERLLGVLEEQGQDKFLAALQKNLRVGSIRLAGQLSYDLHYAAETPLPDGGSQIVIGTDRRMSFAEILNQPRSVNYPFIWIQISLNGDGGGQGEMWPVAKLLSARGRKVVVENYQLQSVLLRSLREEKLTR